MKYDDDMMDALKYFFWIPSQKVHIGVDWAEGSWYNRGEIIKKAQNVIYVRFSDVKI